MYSNRHIGEDINNFMNRVDTLHSVDRLRALDKRSPRIGVMNSFFLIYPDRALGFKPILYGQASMV